jgi:hypothetical protein
MTYIESGAALTAAKREIAQRLRRLCDYCSEAEFDELVSQIAQIEVKYQQRDVLAMMYASGLESLANRSTGMNSAA